MTPAVLREARTPGMDAEFRCGLGIGPRRHSCGRRSRAGRRVAALLACAAALAGCEDVRRDFFPLAAGNSWTYRVRSGERHLGSESIRVTEELKGASGEEGPVGPGRRAGGRTSFFRVIEPGGMAIWGVDRGTVVRSSGATRSIVLLHPPFVGIGWTDDASAPAGKRPGQMVYCKVIGREDVRTSAGWFFGCVVVRREAEDRSSIITQWFAPGVGLVKWRLDQPGRPAVERSLSGYALSPRGPGPKTARPAPERGGP